MEAPVERIGVFLLAIGTHGKGGHSRFGAVVIGRKKFIYDLWGDAVNTASRMESLSSGGFIQITEETYNLVKEDFVCEPRGTIQVKGKGDMSVWFVIKKK